MLSRRVLWVSAATALEPGLSGPSWQTLRQPPAVALNELKNHEFHAVVLQFPLPSWTPRALLGQVRQLAPHLPVLMRNPAVTVPEAVQLAHLGLTALLTGDPGDTEVLREALEGPAPAAADPSNPQGSLLVGTSLAIQHVCEVIRLIGPRRATVLITGETGTGKELAARALHQAGPRRRAPLVAVNCSALPENLLEAELFGHVRGAFTGAVQTRLGRFEQAQGGTLLLDEIGDLPLELQSKLLRVLQERELQRLGSSESIPVDVRVVAATNCDLAERIDCGRFRQDLYYRLNVVPLAMPSLRQHAGDIPLLAEHFVEKVCRAEGIARRRLDRTSLDRLCAYPWPGNVRQLENAVEMAVVLSGDRVELTAADFPLPASAAVPAPLSQDRPLVPVPDAGLDYERTLACIERSILEQALRKTGGNKKAAALMLRLKRTTLSAKVRSLDASAA
ncbi:MAG: sigma-54 dependent transcriptional regulator [Acidobacteriia bacterium]|nr:sigma-54 dependent transcriptional regulator [Terriglobia bacterium]